MLRKRILFSVLLAAALLPRAGIGQAYYENFLGRWQGTSKVLRDGKIVEYAAELEVIAEPGKSRIQMVYKYPDPKPSTDVRFLKLRPDKEEMERSYPHEATEEFKTTGLKQFAATGRGSFTAVRRPTAGDQSRALYRVIFHVDQDLLKYEWQRDDDGKGYGTYSVWSFHR